MTGEGGLRPTEPQGSPRADAAAGESGAGFEQEHRDRRKAAVWAAIAGLTHGAMLLFGDQAYPYVRDLLLGPAYLLLLPAVAHLQLRHAMRGSGATLGTLTGLATVVLGVVGALIVNAQPAAMFALGMWWWTIGKLWAETGVLERTLGLATAGLGALALLASIVWSGLPPLTVLAALPDLPLWELLRWALALWSIALAGALWAQPRPLPPR